MQNTKVEITRISILIETEPKSTLSQKKNRVGECFIPFNNAGDMNSPGGERESVGWLTQNGKLGGVGGSDKGHYGHASSAYQYARGP